MSARSIAIFYNLGANEASQSEKVRVGGAVGALISESPGPSSRILDRDTHYLLPTTYYLLPTTYHLPPTTYYLLILNNPPPPSLPH